MKARWLKNRYYFKLSISIITYSSIMVIFLSFIFSEIYTDSLFGKIAEENMSDIGKMNVAFENLNKEMDQLYLMLQMESDVFAYLNRAVPDDVARGHAIIKADKLYQINPYVSSIILYNRLINDYIILGDQSFQKDQIEALADTGFASRIGIKSFMPEEESADAGSAQRLLSLVYGEAGKTGTRYDSMMIISLDWSKVMKSIFSESNGETVIYDKYGNNISGSPKTPDWDSYWRYVQEESAATGSLRYQNNDDRKIITYCRNNENGWTLINVKAYRDVLGRMNSESLMIVKIAGIVLAFSLVFGYILSRFLYSPIGSVADMVRKSKYADPMQSKGEITLISDAYRDVVRDVVHLEQEKESSRSILKTAFLRKLLSGSLKDDGIFETAESFHMKITQSDIMVIAFKIDYPQHSKEQERMEYENNLMQNADQIVGEHYRTEIVGMSDGSFCLMMNPKEPDGSFESLWELLATVMTTTKATGSGNLTIGIGGMAKNLMQCRLVYENAVEMTKYRFVLGYGCIISQEYVDNNLTGSLNYPEEIEKMLIGAIVSNSREAFEHYLDSITNILRNYVYQDAVLIFLQLSTECLRTMNRQVSGQHMLKINIEDLGMIFGRIQTLHQANSWLTDLFLQYQKIMAEIDSVKTDKHYEKIMEACRYVEENYRDVNLSADMLAEKTGYSANYFAKLFKTITGQNIGDYIKQLRIAEAKRLLKSSDISVNEISMMVGFINSTYFYSAFKKDVGLTPNNYRNCKTEDVK